MEETLITRIIQIARTCHEVNKAYCESIGDFTQPSWKDAPEWQKDSACNGVVFHMAHPESTPADYHKNWLKEKVKTGWKYGPVKDANKKEHPCMVEYEQLPMEQRVKDALFMAVVKSFE